MIPEEKAVIEAALTARRSGLLDTRLRQAVDALIKVREKIAAEACGEQSPTGAMRCDLPRDHSLPDRDDWRFRYHRGIAGDGTRRYWKELRP